VVVCSGEATEALPGRGFSAWRAWGGGGGFQRVFRFEKKKKEEETKGAVLGQCSCILALTLLSESSCFDANVTVRGRRDRRDVRWRWGAEEEEEEQQGLAAEGRQRGGLPPEQKGDELADTARWLVEVPTPEQIRVDCRRRGAFMAYALGGGRGELINTKTCTGTGNNRGVGFSVHAPSWAERY
jgi:hypothetical protein